MISLILSVISSSLVSIIMRFSTGRIKYNLGMLTMNYVVCTLLSGLFGGLPGALDLGDPRIGTVLALGVVNGILYLGSFILIQMTIRTNGVVLSSVFQKLGLLVTLVISVVFYREIPDLLQSIGFVLAVFAIFLMNYQKGERAGGSLGLLIVMLLGCGMGNAMSKIFKESAVAALEGQFLFYTFGVALVLCAVCMTVSGQKIGCREAIFGVLIAVPNFFSSKFLLGALEGLSAVIVYPVFSVGCILVVTLAGVLAFRERLEKKQWIGVVVILAALVLLNI